jgi:hypothetical protein
MGNTDAIGGAMRRSPQIEIILPLTRNALKK